MTKNKARELLWPSDPDILLRIAFLYVGQGSSTIVLAKDGDTYKSVLIDINLDSTNGGVNIPILISDLLDGNNLDVFVNTHPHDDHLQGIIELSDKVGINEVWHSGHKPSKKYDDAYNDLKTVIKKVKDAGGVETKLKGSKEEKNIGEASYCVLAPAKYVIDDVNDEDADTRDRRIHEQCVVMKFGTKETWGMTPGDADRDAFEKHITKYHEERLTSVVLAASHHGSRNFFRYDEEEPYLEALNKIDPEYVIISAPKQGESKYDHPHEDAVKFYADKVGQKNIFHTGLKRRCYIFDIFQDGTYSDEIQDDSGELAKVYPIEEDDNGGKVNQQSFTKREQITKVTGNRYA